MPDESVMLSCHEATGPIYGRPKAPPDVRAALDWPPPVEKGRDADGSERYDMTGLDFRNTHLRSTDFGVSWEVVSADPFRSCLNGITCEAEDALADGTILRGVWGPYLPYDDVPFDGYIQRSTDGSRSSGEPGWVRQALLTELDVTIRYARLYQNDRMLFSNPTWDVIGLVQLCEPERAIDRDRTFDDKIAMLSRRLDLT